MKFEWHKVMLVACSALILTSCGPKKEEAPAPEQKQAVPTTATHPQEGILTPHQEEELKIEEENIFDTNPPG